MSVHVVTNQLRQQGGIDSTAHAANSTTVITAARTSAFCDFM